jgi:phosphoglucosamine mutase
LDEPLKLFGTSGIRGVVNEELTSDLALEVGMALAAYSRGGNVTLGRDTRTSSLMLENALSAGLIGCGCNVSLLGVIPTPVCAFLTKRLNANAGAMITASHNPPEYNGIKLFNQDSMAYDREQQLEVEKLIIEKKFKQVEWKKIGKTTKTDETRLYVNQINKAIAFVKKWHIVVDPGCGAASIIAPEIFKTLGCKVTSINSQPDGFFPGRPPEPTEEALVETSRVVKELNADIGFAYDGDADRVVIIDERGVVQPPDISLAAYASYIVEKSGGGKIVTHVDASMCVEDAVNAVGGKVVRTKVGDVNISSMIRKQKAIFGGEPCGAWIHPKFHYTPDGIYSSILYLKMLEEKNTTAAKLTQQIKQYPLLRRKFSCPKKFLRIFMAKIEEKIVETFPNYKEKLTIDGTRISVPHGWVLLRPSGTEPVLRISVEAVNIKDAKEMMGKTLKMLDSIRRELI